MEILVIVALVALVAAAVIVIAHFELLCLRELAGTSDVELRYMTRAGWTALIIIAIPLGGIAYLYLGRTRECRLPLGDCREPAFSRRDPCLFRRVSADDHECDRL